MHVPTKFGCYVMDTLEVMNYLEVKTCGSGNAAVAIMARQHKFDIKIFHLETWGYHIQKTA